jgi:electron transfer flavoprotein alpha subunit
MTESLSPAALIVAEQDGPHLADATRIALTGAQACAPAVDVLVAGEGVAALAQAAARLPGVRRVLWADAPSLAQGLAENLAPLVASLAAGYSHVIWAGTACGRNVAPRVAALLDVAPVAEVSRVLAPNVFERPIYAGSAIATVQCDEPVKVLTLRTVAFDAAPAERGAELPPAPIEPVAAGADAGLSQWLGRERVQRDRPDLSAARVIVAGGRPFGSAEQFEALLAPLADRLGAALGASLAAVDAGCAPSDWQVGQSGRVVAPELYIACGISGAVQHLAGMKDSRVIVAINHDPDAPIFEVADYGLVGDLFTAVPELTARLGDPTP